MENRALDSYPSPFIVTSALNTFIWGVVGGALGKEGLQGMSKGIPVAVLGAISGASAIKRRGAVGIQPGIEDLGIAIASVGMVLVTGASVVNYYLVAPNAPHSSMADRNLTWYSGFGAGCMLGGINTALFADNLVELVVVSAAYSLASRIFSLS